MLCDIRVRQRDAAPVPEFMLKFKEYYICPNVVPPLRISPRSRLNRYSSEQYVNSKFKLYFVCERAVQTKIQKYT